MPSLNAFSVLTLAFRLITQTQAWTLQFKQSTAFHATFRIYNREQDVSINDALPEGMMRNS